MKFIINETKRIEDLTIIDTKTGTDWSNDLIGNSGAIGAYIHYDDAADAYRINQEDFDWWAKYISMYERYQEELGTLRDQYGADAVNDIIYRPEHCLSDDYTVHEQELQDLISSIKDELA